MRNLTERLRRPLRNAPALLALAVTACGRGDAGTAAAARELGPPVPFQNDDLLHDVRDVAVDGAGRVWVLAGLDPFVRTYAPDGTLVRSFGRPGRGPGEVMNPWSLFLTGDAAAPVGVWDVGMRRLVRYHEDGTPSGTQAVDVPPNTVRSDMRDVTYGSVDVLRGWGGGFVLQDEPVGVLHPSHILHSRLVRLDGAGRTVSTLADFRRRFRREIIALGSASTMVPLPLWTTCTDGGLVFLDPFRPALVWMDSAGRERASTRLPAPEGRIGEDDRRRYLSHVIELELQGQALEASFVQSRVDNALRMQRSRFAQTVPPAVDLLCDARGEAWLQRFSTADHPLGFGREWTVVDRRGNSRTVRFPPAFSRASSRVTPPSAC